MEKALEEVKKEIINFLISYEFNNWEFVSMKFQFAPYINRGYKGQWFFMDSDKKVIDHTFFLSEECNLIFFKFIFKYNQNEDFNTLDFFAKKDDYENATISISFDQIIEDNFQNNLPKSKRGKTLPWWKIESETVGLG